MSLPSFVPYLKFTTACMCVYMYVRARVCARARAGAPANAGEREWGRKPKLYAYRRMPLSAAVRMHVWPP
jgi:hypothetical protein